jgi:hypothetical protein
MKAALAPGIFAGQRGKKTMMIRFYMALRSRARRATEQGYAKRAWRSFGFF